MKAASIASRRSCGEKWISWANALGRTQKAARNAAKGVKRRIATLPFKSASKRRPADVRWPLHDDETSALQMFDETFRQDLGHDLVGVVNALATLLADAQISVY